LHVDLYVVAEHAMQLGLMDIKEAMKDPGEREILRQHLHDEHTMKHLVESVSKYDTEAAEYIRDGQVRWYHKEQAVRDLVELWAKHGLDPRILKEIILNELQKITAFWRTRTAQNNSAARNTSSGLNHPDTADGMQKG
jgi:hypothetical protein